jgi:hypothetical protein
MLMSEESPITPPEPDRLTEALQRADLQERVNSLSEILQVIASEKQEEANGEASFRWEMMDLTKEMAQEGPPHSLPAVLPNPSSAGSSTLPASTPRFLRFSLEKQKEFHRIFNE